LHWGTIKWSIEIGYHVLVLIDVVEYDNSALNESYIESTIESMATCFHLAGFWIYSSV